MTMFRTIDTRRRSELDVLHYEIWMLNHLFPDRFTETENRLLLNATLESFLIHARNLLQIGDKGVGVWRGNRQLES